MSKKLVLTCLFLISAPALANEEAAQIAAEKGVFSGTLADAAWTILAFVLLLVLLGKFAWRPMLNGLKARQEHIAQQIANAEGARRQAEKTLLDYSKKVEAFEAKGQELLKKAQEQANTHGLELTEKARQEALAIKQKATDDITAAQAVASEQLWSEVGDVVLALGSEVLGRRITKEDNHKLIDEAIAKLRQHRQAVRS